VFVTEVEGERDDAPLREGEAVVEGEGVPRAEPEGDSEPRTLRDAEGHADSLRVGGCEGEAEAQEVGAPVSRALRDSEGQPEDEREARGDCESFTVALVVALNGLAVTGEGEGRGERLPVPEGVKDADSEGQGDAEGENRALREGAALALGAERVGGGDGE
jgi:hypothetical protein